MFLVFFVDQEMRNFVQFLFARMFQEMWKESHFLAKSEGPGESLGQGLVTHRASECIVLLCADKLPITDHRPTIDRGLESLTTA